MLETLNQPENHMKPLATFRLSKTFSFSLSPELHEQISTSITPTTSMSAILRIALIRFLDAPPEQPNIDHLFKTAPMPKRNRSAVVAIKSPELRKQLDDYANTHNLTASAVARRAVYEYTKGTDPNPTATIDAWGDAEKRSWTYPEILDLSITLWYNITWVGGIVFSVRFCPLPWNLTNVRKVRSWKIGSSASTAVTMCRSRGIKRSAYSANKTESVVQGKRGWVGASCKSTARATINT